MRDYIPHPPVTDADRDNMGVPNRNGNRRPQNRPAERVEFSFRLKGIRQLQLDFRVQGASNKERPAHYAGAVVVWDVLNEAPAHPKDLTNHALACRTPYAINFDGTQRGKRGYAALCWENEKGQRGAWSEVKAAIVP
jgi:hypothetical protein